MLLRTLTSAGLLMLVFAAQGQSTLDYKQLEYWAAHPDKIDASDFIPSEDLEKNTPKSVDVFFIHPTTYTKRKIDKSWNAPIDDLALNNRTDSSTIKLQATVFNGVARIFAPRYRQAHYHTFFPRKVKGNADPIFQIAYEDVLKAFETYLETWNGGRPFIIAAHSQGTKHGERLIKELIDGQASIKNKMIVAYLIGMPIKKNAFQEIPVCDEPDQTNCFVAWRTYKTGHFPKRKWRTEEEIVVVNPISWTTDPTITHIEDHLGIVLRKFNMIHPGKLTAQVAKNVLWVTKPRFPFSFLISTKNYHIADYNLFWMDIRNNVETRVKSYLSTN